MEGRSLGPLLRGETITRRPGYAMDFSMDQARGEQITKETAAVWDGDYKLVHYLNENKSLLFNLKKDPEETRDLFDQEPGMGRRLLTLVQDRLE